MVRIRIQPTPSAFHFSERLKVKLPLKPEAEAVSINWHTNYNQSTSLGKNPNTFICKTKCPGGCVHKYEIDPQQFSCCFPFKCNNKTSSEGKSEVLMLCKSNATLHIKKKASYCSCLFLLCVLTADTPSDYKIASPFYPQL